MRRSAPRASLHSDGLTKTQAEAGLRAMMAEQDLEEVLSVEVRRTTPTASRGDGTEAVDTSELPIESGREIKPRIGHRSLSQVRREDIEAFRDGCCETDLRQVQTTLSASSQHLWSFRPPGLGADESVRYVDNPKALDADTGD